jgi:hypothetical protein
MRSPTAFSDENITPGTFNAIIFNLHAGDWKPKLTGKPLDDIHMNQWGVTSGGDSLPIPGTSFEIKKVFRRGTSISALFSEICFSAIR